MATPKRSRLITVGTKRHCMTHYAKDKSTRLVRDKNFPLGVRPYSVREFARLQGLPDSFHFPVSATSAYKQIGNGVSVPVGQWLGSEMKRYMRRDKPLSVDVQAWFKCLRQCTYG